jgi:hypothetical protein
VNRAACSSENILVIIDSRSFAMPRELSPERPAFETIGNDGQLAIAISGAYAKTHRPPEGHSLHDEQAKNNNDNTFTWSGPSGMLGFTGQQAKTM